MYEKRDWNDPAYKKFRQEVMKRDSFMCKWPGCTKTYSLQVHHIKTWGEYPHLRFEVSNGVTLCRECHEKLKGKEKDNEMFLYKIVSLKNTNKKYTHARKPVLKPQFKPKVKKIKKDDDFLAKYLKLKHNARYKRK